jgi:hypothetical protein
LSRLQDGQRQPWIDTPAKRRSSLEVIKAACSAEPAAQCQAHDPGIHDHLPELRAPGGGDDAGRCLPVFLQLQGLRNAAQAEAWRLLRFLFLRDGALPAEAGCLRSR